MNNIQMIPVEQLHHHPENPRLELGDLSELTESIRKNGIMQNLTVVSRDPLDEHFYVVIGNRRMEAAKAAGLTELPCVISDMDHRTQIATMLEENMQRADLTVYEQAQGFQMMMDLGFRPEEISEKTGFSETTVRRRLKMAELDKNIFQKAVGKQITIDDLDRLAKVDSIKERNALLKDYGEQNYSWAVTRAINVQESKKKKPEARKILKAAGIEKLPDRDRYSYGKYRELYSEKCRLYEWDGKKNFIPKIKEGTLFYTEDDTTISFYLKEKKQKSDAPKKTEAEKEEEKRIALAWKTVDRCAETAAELRKAYADGMTVGPKNAMRMMQWALVAAFTAMWNYSAPKLTVKNELKPEGVYTPDILADLKKKIMDLPQSRWPGLILMMFEGDWRGMKNKPPRWADGERARLPKYKKNVPMDLCYEWLTEFGYEMSTEEIRMMGGTHPVFQEVIKA